MLIDMLQSISNPNVYISRQMWSVVIRCYKNLWLFKNRNEPHYYAIEGLLRTGNVRLIQKRFVTGNAYMWGIKSSWWAKSVQFLWYFQIEITKKTVKIYLSKESCVLAEKSFYLLQPVFAMMRACSSIVSEISKWLWIWSWLCYESVWFIAGIHRYHTVKKAKEHFDRKEDSYKDQIRSFIKTMKFGAWCDFFSLFGSLVWFFAFLHIHEPIHARSSQTSLSFRFGLSNALCHGAMPWSFGLYQSPLLMLFFFAVLSFHLSLSFRGVSFLFAHALIPNASFNSVVHSPVICK